MRVTTSYPLFADAATGIYPHTASQYHALPKAKRGIAMLSEFSKFIPCPNDVCQIMKRFRSFKISHNLSSGLNHRINTVLLGRMAATKTVASQRQRKWTAAVIAIVTSSMTLLSHYI